MDSPPFTCLIVSDFTPQNFAGSAANDPDPPALRTVFPPAGPPAAALLDAAASHWRPRPDVLVVWTQPHTACPAFEALLRGEAPALETVLQDVDRFAGLAAEAARRVRFAFVPSWVLPAPRGRWGMTDLKPGTGPADVLIRMNLRLSESLAPAGNVHVLNAQRWIERAGADAFSPKLWYLGKIPFGPAVFAESVRDIKAALRGLLGQARKLIILDLDDTLWGGLVGEVGWEALVLGGHHPAGEAYADFQRALKFLQHRGVLLAIVSKNDERTAVEAIRRHPEMVLREEDFAARRINWDDKARNVLAVLGELNLGPQAAVFIDDSPAERARVGEALPEVLVPDWPKDPLLYPSALLGLRCFDAPSVSREDLNRTALYRSEGRRRELRERVGSLEEWLKGLGTRLQVETLHPANLQRAAQLLNKTNQMNLSTRRLSEAELMQWAEPEHRTLWTFRVSDRFGDAGLTGIASLEIEGRTARLVDFVVSCRVLGRRIEEAMLAVAARHAEARGAARLTARFRPTAKNGPCLEFFKSLSPRFREEDGRFVWDASRPFPFPEHIELIR